MNVSPGQPKPPIYDMASLSLEKKGYKEDEETKL